MTNQVFHQPSKLDRVHPRLSKRNGERLRSKKGRTASIAKPAGRFVAVGDAFGDVLAIAADS